MWAEGGKYGSIDPCYPSKVAQAHIHNLLFQQHARRRSSTTSSSHASRTCRRSWLRTRWTRRSCPIVAGAPEVMKAAFTKEIDFFAPRGHRVPRPGADASPSRPASRGRCSRPGARGSASPRTRATSPAARAWKALRHLRRRHAERRAARSSRRSRRRTASASCCSARPYHSDPGLNHGIPEEFQVLGYPILSMRSIPEGSEVARTASSRTTSSAGCIETPLDVHDVWPENYSANSRAEGVGGQVRGAPPERRGARPLELQVRPRRADLRPHRLASSRPAATPYSALHDIDANKPGGSIKIRVKTYAHTLKLFEEELADTAAQRSELQRRVDAKRRELLLTWRTQLRQKASADPRARRELEELEAAFASYMEDEATVPASVSAMEPARLDIAPPPPEIKPVVFHRSVPLEIRP